MKMRFWYRRWWLTELMALAAGGLAMLALYKGLGWDGGRRIWAVFLTGALVVTAAGEAPLRKMRERGSARPERPGRTSSPTADSRSRD